MEDWETDLRHRIVTEAEKNSADSMAEFSRVIQAATFIAGVAFACVFTHAYFVQDATLYWSAVASLGSFIGFLLAGGLHKRCRMITNRFWEVKESITHQVDLLEKTNEELRLTVQANEVDKEKLRKELNSAKRRPRILVESNSHEVPDDAPIEAEAIEHEPERARE